MKNNRKPKDEGSPTVTVEYVMGTPEEVEETRRGIESALSTVLSRLNGCSVKCTIDWDEMPENYGRPHTYKGGKIVFLD